MPSAGGGGFCRAVFTKGSGLKQMRSSELTAVLPAYHNTSRQRLGYRTPAAVFVAAALQLKCESTGWIDGRIEPANWEHRRIAVIR